MGIYENVHGEIKITPDLSVEEINYFRGRFQNYIMSFDWKNWASTEEEALEWAKKQAENHIKMEKINIEPYRGFNKTYLEFIAKMFGDRVSGKVKISLSTTYGDPNINGGLTNSETTIEFKDSKVIVNLPSSESIKKKK